MIGSELEEHDTVRSDHKYENLSLGTKFAQICLRPHPKTQQHNSRYSCVLWRGIIFDLNIRQTNTG